WLSCSLSILILPSSMVMYRASSLSPPISSLRVISPCRYANSFFAASSLRLINSLNSPSSASLYLIVGPVCSSCGVSNTDFVNSGSYLRTVFVFISGMTTFTGLAGKAGLVGVAGFFVSGLGVTGGGGGGGATDLATMGAAVGFVVA